MGTWHEGLPVDGRKVEKAARSNPGQLPGGGRFPAPCFLHQEKKDFSKPPYNKFSLQHQELPINSKKILVVTNENK